MITKLLKVRPDTIVTLIGGSPVEMPWEEKAGTILWSYYAGMESGTALAGILTGRINPSGKLAETFPRVYEDTPTGHNGQFGRDDMSVRRRNYGRISSLMRKMIFCRCSALDMDSLIQNLRITICR